MKKIILILLLATALIAQVHSDSKPEMFYQHQGQTYFVTNIQEVEKEGVTSYEYQSVAISGYGEADLLNALLADFDNSIPFIQYRARCVERVNFALYGTVDVSKATACGYESDITENEMKELLGVVNYR